MPAPKKADKWKLKKWFTIYAPKVFNGVQIGEMPANDDKAAMDRNITVSLDVITHNPQHAYTNITFRTIEISGASANTKLVEMTELYSYIRSLVRRYRSIASSVLPVSSKDGTQMIVKLLVVTKQRTGHSKILGMRKEMNSLTAEYFKGNDYGAVINAIIEGKFQSDLAGKLEHIAPINRLEVRKLEVKQ